MINKCAGLLPHDVDNKDSALFFSLTFGLLVDSRSSHVDNQDEPSQMVGQYLFYGQYNCEGEKVLKVLYEYCQEEE